MFLKICECCGKVFEARSNNTRFCYDDHYVKCEICGKEYKISRAQLLDRGPIGTCSRKCAAEKARRTNQEKYGVNNVSQSKEIKDKKKKNSLEKYGTEYPQQSKEVQDKIKNTNMEKYGVDNVFKLDSVQEQINQTNLEKYGAIRPLQNEKIKQKEIQTMNERYGANSPLSNKEVQEKARKTNQKHRGVDWPGQDKECYDKARKTCLDKYGNEHYTKSEDYHERVPGIIKKRKDTYMKHYGAESFVASNEYKERSEEIRQKAKETNKKRYGVEEYAQSKEGRQNLMSDPSKIDEWMNFLNDPVQYIQNHYEEKPTIYKLTQDFGIAEAALDKYIIEFNLYPYISMYKSTMEQEILDILKDIEPNLNIICNIRTIIPHGELDIYLPDYKLAIECNPTATHNSTMSIYPNSEPKDYKYHLRKTDSCEEQGIFLFHIFGYDWTNRKDIIISMLKNLLGKTENKIYARKCEIKDVSYKEANTFLINNHRQGSASSKIRLGLYYDNELVSLMTFGKMRSGIGTGKEDLSDCYELVRFCNKINTNVVGGASKLFKHFLREYNPVRVRSFSDRAHTKGNLYKTLGFYELRRSTSGYVWVDFKTDVAYNRTTCRKSNLKNLFKNEEIDLSKTEREIMEEHGFVRVFDCGTITWEYDNKNSNL